MSERTNIPWCDATMNPWSGCQRISPACEHCYAADLPAARRRHAEWGDHPMMMAAPSYWRQPFGWNLKARMDGIRRKVFVGSTMDIGEDRPELTPIRDRTLALVALTPDLDWLWLTKRPETLVRYFQDPGLYSRVLHEAQFLRTYLGADGIHRQRRNVPNVGISDPGLGLATWYPNLWLGVTAENQATADARIPLLLQVPARARFVSVEPMLGPVDLDLGTYPGLEPYAFCESRECGGREVGGNLADCDLAPCDDWKRWAARPRIGWVICGGESGRDARPMHPDWARSLRDQCQAAGVPFFFKQWGEWRRCAPPEDWEGTDPNRYLIQSFNGHLFAHVGTRSSGHLLDGREWREMP